MEYKVGDIVRIKTKEQLVREFGEPNEFGVIYHANLSLRIVSVDLELCSQMHVIECIYDGIGQFDVLNHGMTLPIQMIQGYASQTTTRTNWHHRRIPLPMDV